MIYLYFDIETFAGEKPSLSEVKVPANYKKEDTIQKYREDNLEDHWRKQSLDKFKCQVVCISAYLPEYDKWFSETGSNEKILIQQFEDWIVDTVGEHNLINVTFVGKYISEFDLPILRIRALKYRMKLSTIIPSKRYSDRCINIEDRILGTSYKDTVSLSKLLAYFDLEPKLQNGGDVFDLWLNKEYEAIEEYCKDDVLKVYELGKIVGLLHS